MGTAPSGGGGMKIMTIIGPTIGAILVVGFVLVRQFGLIPGFGGGSSSSTNSSEEAISDLGTKFDAADPTKIIKSLEKRAKKWKGDAKFYSVNILGMKNDGTIDFGEGSSTMTVEFFSPKLVGSTSATKRKDSIRKYVINKYKVDEQVWGVKKRYENVPGTPIPKCKAKDLGKLLKDKGLKGDNTAHINLDPGFAFATDGVSFNVHVQKPKLHLYVQIDTCEIIKEM